MWQVRSFSLGVSFVVLMVSITALSACSDNDILPGPGPLEPVGGVENPDEGIAGSGSIATDRRELGSIDQIRFVSEGTVDVRHGDTELVTIEADDNLLQFIETSVVDGVLQIETTESVDLAPTQPPRFTIQVIDLVGVEFAGAGAMTVDATQADTFELAFDGVGDLSIDDLTVDELRLDLDGVGRVRLGGSARSQIGTIDGVTDYDGGDLATATAALEAAGTSTNLVWITDVLVVTASGLAEVRYYGDPTVEIDTSDSATVAALGDR